VPLPVQKTWEGGEGESEGLGGKEFESWSMRRGGIGDREEVSQEMGILIDMVFIHSTLELK